MSAHAERDVASSADAGDLEAERDFLLTSLDDLDAELLAGNIDPDTYRTLHDDYTARAAAVITAIETGPSRASSDAARVPPVMRLLTVGGIVAFAVLAAFLLAHALGQRSPGQSLSGNAQLRNPGGGTGTSTPASSGSGPSAAALDAARATAAAEPKSYDAQINYARLLMSSGDIPNAVKQFVNAAKLDPTQPEPLAYSGWLTALVARQVTDASTKRQLVDAAGRSIDKALAVDPTYLDAYAFKGLVLFQLENKPCDGAAALQQFLVEAPEANPMRPLVLSTLSDAVKAGNCPPLTSSPTSRP